MLRHPILSVRPPTTTFASLGLNLEDRQTQLSNDTILPVSIDSERLEQDLPKYFGRRSAMRVQMCAVILRCGISDLQPIWPALRRQASSGSSCNRNCTGSYPGPLAAPSIAGVPNANTLVAFSAGDNSLFDHVLRQIQRDHHTSAYSITPQPFLVTSSGVTLAKM